MKIFKSESFPTQQTFLTACESYQEYYKRRQKGENTGPRVFDPLVMKYVSALFRAKKTGEEPANLEFIDLTEAEWLAVQRKKENLEKGEERRLAAEQRAAEARVRDLKKAAGDKKFKKLFIRSEMSRAGFAPDELIIKLIETLWDGENHKEYKDRRRKTQQDLEKEIKQYSER